ncbi:MAG: LUD domain-containing protein [Thermodesulfobacteriota bacterium]
MSDESRARILEALEDALAGAPEPAAPAFPAPSPPARPDWPALSREITANGGRFALARSAAEARGALASLARTFSVRRAVLWDHPALSRLGLADALRGAGVEAVLPDQRPDEFKAAAAECDLGVTGADALILESGTLIVVARPGQERATSLFPPVHLALVTRETEILPRIPDLGPWLQRQRDGRGRPPAAIHCITGPSSTADIELVKVRGVHGPTTLAVVAVEE